MRKLLLILLAVTIFYTPQMFAQKSKRIWLTDKVSIPAEREGCPWVSSSVWKQKAPSDLAGIIVYGFRKIFGKNVAYTAHYNCPPVIDAIDLSNKVVYIKPGSSDNSTEESPKIDILVLYRDLENDTVVFNYKVSGGKIIGVGKKVVWDLSGTQPGTYSINICIDDGLGCDIDGAKNIQTKEVEVLECPDCK